MRTPCPTRAAATTTARLALSSYAATLILLAGLPAQDQAPRPGIDWPQFRGVQAAGVAEGQPLPTKWDVTKNQGVRWKTAIPGLAHSSPIAWGDRVFVTTAVPKGAASSLKIGLYGAGDSADDMVEHRFQLWCLDRRDGRPEWMRTAKRMVPRFKRHTKATHVDSTPVTDGTHVVALFGSHGLTCYNVSGELRWQVDLGELDVGPHNSLDLEWGYASSPIIADGKVIVQADVKQQPFLAAWHVATGKPAWRVARDDVPGWATPTAVQTPAGMQIIVNGCKHMGGYLLADGAEVWRMPGGGGIPIPAPIVAGDTVLLTSNHRPLHSSHPVKPVFAVKLTAKGTLPIPRPGEPTAHVAWMQTRIGNYIQTPIVYRGLLYLGAANGVVTVADPGDGTRFGRHRLGAGGVGFSASPVAGGGHVYYTSEEGEVHVVKAGKKFETHASNPLGEICMATPAIASGTLLFRTRHHLVCVGDAPAEK